MFVCTIKKTVYQVFFSMVGSFSCIVILIGGKQNENLRICESFYSRTK